MKRVAVLAVVVLVCSASAAVALWREPLMSALGFGGERAPYLGYIEGETSLIARGVESGEFRPVDPMLTVRSLIGPMLLSIIWKTVFEPIGAEKLDVKALARHHADLMLHALRPESGQGKAGAS